jgi:hypothetical protein
MKNRMKITLAVMVTAILLIASFAIGISAADDRSVEIYGYNLSYGGTISVMYALDHTELLDGETLAVQVYDGIPGAEGTKMYTVKDYQISTDAAVEGKPVFFSPGIPLKNMTMQVFAVPVILNSEGTVVVSGELTKYSVLEYIFERQVKYADKTTDVQKAFYANLLATGESAQQVLNYNLSDSPDDYYYVTATDASYMGFDAGIVKKGDKLTLAYTGEESPIGWNAVGVTVNPDGTLTESAPVAYGLDEKITINSHVVITPALAPAAPTDYRGQGLFYNDETKSGNRYSMEAGTTLFNDSSAYVQPTSVDGALVVDNRELTEAGKSKVYEVHWKFNNSSVNNPTSAVFEADVKFDDLTDKDLSYGTRFQIYFKDVSVNLVFRTDAEGNYYIYDTKVERSMWYNVRVEIDSSYNTKFYLNGALIFEHNANDTVGRPSGLWAEKNTSASYAGRVVLQMRGGNNLKENHSIDNVYVNFELAQ